MTEIRKRSANHCSTLSSEKTVGEETIMTETSNGANGLTKGHGGGDTFTLTKQSERRNNSRILLGLVVFLGLVILSPMVREKIIMISFKPVGRPTSVPEVSKSFGSYKVLSRPFDPVYNRTLCFPSTSAWANIKTQLFTQTKQGLLYLKLMKVGGSTFSGVNVRIAKNMANRVKPGSDICRSRQSHWAASRQGIKFGERIVNESFLWTTVRNPIKRYVSEFYHFQVTRRNVAPTLENLKRYIFNFKRSHYLDWLQMHVPFDDKEGSQIATTNKTGVASLLNSIMKEYDFISITERMPESMVVLSMLLDVPLGDVLHLDAKRAGGYDDGLHHNLCFKILPANLTKEMKDFLYKDPELTALMAPDVALYEAANHSLDLTIDRLGRELVEERVKVFQHAQKKAEEVCLKKTRFPCSSDGERQIENDCLFEDYACGLLCLDVVSDFLGISG